VLENPLKEWHNSVGIYAKQCGDYVGKTCKKDCVESLCKTMEVLCDKPAKQWKDYVGNLHKG
jgi:hypothetical protein